MTKISRHTAFQHCYNLFWRIKHICWVKVRNGIGSASQPFAEMVLEHDPEQIATTIPEKRIVSEPQFDDLLAQELIFA